MRRLTFLFALVAAACAQTLPCALFKARAGASTPNLLFEWHAEDTTVTSGTPAGTSVGDTTATANASVSLSTTQVYDGTKAVKISGANDRYSFDWASSPAIVNPNAGTIDFRLYFTTVGDQSIFELNVDANNRIAITIDTGGYLLLRHVAGGTTSLARTTFPILTTGVWHHVKARWDVNAHNGLYLSISCDQDQGETNSAANGTDALGTFAGSSGSVRIGDITGAAGVYYIDALYIYDIWKTETEVYYVDPGAVGSTQTGTSANPHLSLNGALLSKANRVFVNPVQIRCLSSDGTADTTRVFDGYNSMATTSSLYLQIVAETGHRAGPTWSPSKYRLSVPFASGAGTGTSLALNHDYIYVDGLQIELSSVAGQDAAAEIVYISNGDTGYLSNCHIKGSGLVNATLIRGISSIHGINVFNTIIDVRTALATNEGVKNHGPSFIYSCTVLGGAGVAFDVANDSSITAKNCYLQGDTASFRTTAPNSDVFQTTCATSDALSTTVALRNIAINTTNFTNVTATTENWALPSGSALKDVGTNTSGDPSPFNFTTDINGATRTGTWDIGADEF
jgi:hypothetical protein